MMSVLLATQRWVLSIHRGFNLGGITYLYYFPGIKLSDTLQIAINLYVVRNIRDTYVNVVPTSQLPSHPSCTKVSGILRCKFYVLDSKGNLLTWKFEPECANVIPIYYPR